MNREELERREFEEAFKEFDKVRTKRQREEMFIVD